MRGMASVQQEINASIAALTTEKRDLTAERDGLLAQIPPGQLINPPQFIAYSIRRVDEHISRADEHILELEKQKTAILQRGTGLYYYLPWMALSC